jgi:peptidoglycan hydrolase-like protein with peptidoglycan-binding domain
MFLACKVAWVGVVFILLTTGISSPPPASLASAPNLSQEASPVGPRTDVRKMQQTLQDKVHYSGVVDGVFGLRTRASIRGFQKAENLPATGILDPQTAGKLGVTPEGREGTVHETAQGKPSAGIKSTPGSRRTSKHLRKPARRVAANESGRAESDKTLQAETDKHPQ